MHIQANVDKIIVTMQVDDSMRHVAEAVQNLGPKHRGDDYIRKMIHRLTAIQQARSKQK